MPWDAWRARKPDDFVATGFFRDVRRLSTHLFRFPHPQQSRTQLHGVFFFKGRAARHFQGSHGNIPFENWFWETKLRWEPES